MTSDSCIQCGTDYDGDAYDDCPECGEDTMNGCGRNRTLLYEKLTDVLHHIRECEACELWLTGLIRQNREMR